MPTKEGQILLFDPKIEKTARRNNSKNKRQKQTTKSQQQHENTTNSVTDFPLNLSTMAEGMQQRRTRRLCNSIRA